MSTQWIQTYTGRQFFPAAPRAEDVHIEDIAHALSLLCRFTGHSRWHYSVGQHSALVSYACDPADALHGLLHDGSEAYLGDVSSPLKRQAYLAGYRFLEDVTQRAVCDRFGLPHALPPSVAHADLVVLATEARDVMGKPPAWWGPLPEPLSVVIEELRWWQAERRFLERFEELTIGRGRTAA